MHKKKYDNKILLVDDDAKNLQVAMSILKEFNVIYAQSGSKALELLEKNDFDLILLDIVMPNMDGYEVCQIIKQNEKHKNIPVIFLTVKDDEKDIVKGFDYGAVDYITKPFYSAVLLKRVELHLNLAQALGSLKDMNTNLTYKVEEQVEEIRKKDQILFQQSKISAIKDMIDVISREWNQPLYIIKLYLQSLQMQLTNKTIDREESSEVITKTMAEVDKLDETMLNFQTFFKDDSKKQDVNIKVLIDSVIFILKEGLNNQKVNINIDGCNLINFSIIKEELKHILMRLITYSMDNFKRLDLDQKYITFDIQEDDSHIYIKYTDNTQKICLDTMNKMFDLDHLLKTNSFDLGFYLMSLFIEKNGGVLDIETTSQNDFFVIRFNK